MWSHLESPLLAHAECAIGEEISGQKCCIYHQLSVTQHLLHTSARFTDLRGGWGSNTNKPLNQRSIFQGIYI